MGMDRESVTNNGPVIGVQMAIFMEHLIMVQVNWMAKIAAR